MTALVRPQPRRRARRAWFVAGAALAIVGLANPAGAFPGPSDDIPTATTGNLGGATNTATSVEASKATWANGGADHALVARDDNFADALAGTALSFRGPMLLTATSSLHADVKAELQRVLPSGKTVFLLGGTSAVSDAVKAEIESAGYTTKRLAGLSRIATAVAITDQVKTTGLGITTIYLARAMGPASNPNGTGAWADSAAAGSALAASQYAGSLLLTPTDSLDSSVSSWLQTNKPARVLLLGGEAALSKQVEDAVRAALPSADVARRQGADRSETAAAIAGGNEPWLQKNTTKYVLVNGYVDDGWASALTGAGYAGASGAAGQRYAKTLWTPDTGAAIPPATVNLIKSCAGGAKKMATLVVGGTGQIDQARMTEIESLDEGAGCP